MGEAASITIQRSDRDPEGNPWLAIGNDFANQMFSLLHISKTLIPKTNPTPEDYLDLRVKKIARLLTREEAKEFGEALSWLLSSFRSMSLISTEDVPKGELSTDRNSREGVNEEGSNRGELQGGGDEIGGGLSIASPNVSTAFLQFVHDMATGITGSNHETLRKSLLVTAVSNFEILFGRLVQEVYKVNKAALNDSDYSFSLQELAQFRTLEDAREFLIERRVSALMRESVDGWEKWLGKAVKGASMAGTPVNWPVTREVFARRNLLVHNGGIVNRIYLSTVSRLDGSPNSGVEVGDILEVDAEYFSTAVENLLALGVVVTADVACRLSKDSARELHGGLLFDADMALKRGAWHASLAISKYLLSCQLRRMSQLRAQLINWVARKKIHGLDDIRSEVEDWDTGGLADKVSHYKDVLLGDKGKAIEKVEELISRKELPLVEIALHPVYEDLIEDLPSISRNAAETSSVADDRKADGISGR